MDKQYKSFVSEEKQFDDEEMSIVHVISVETEDRYGDVVRAEGLNTENFRKNPVVLYGHDQRSFPVGKSLWQKVTVLPSGKKAVIAKTQFTKSTEEGRTVYALWKEGMLNAASIGFMPGEYEPILDGKQFLGYDFKSSELLEYSIVPVPANQEAVRLAFEKGMNGSEKVLNELRKAVQHDEIVELRSQIATLQEKMGELLNFMDNQRIFNIAASEDAEKFAKDIHELKKYHAEIVAKQKADDLLKKIGESVRGAISKQV